MARPSTDLDWGLLGLVLLSPLILVAAWNIWVASALICLWLALALRFGIGESENMKKVKNRKKVIKLASR